MVMIPIRLIWDQKSRRNSSLSDSVGIMFGNRPPKHLGIHPLVRCLSRLPLWDVDVCCFLLCKLHFHHLFIPSYSNRSGRILPFRSSFSLHGSERKRRKRMGAGGSPQLEERIFHGGCRLHLISSQKTAVRCLHLQNTNKRT